MTGGPAHLRDLPTEERNPRTLAIDRMPTPCISRLSSGGRPHASGNASRTPDQYATTICQMASKSVSPVARLRYGNKQPEAEERLSLSMSMTLVSVITASLPRGPLRRPTTTEASAATPKASLEKPPPGSEPSPRRQRFLIGRAKALGQLRELADDMLETLRAAHGVGLAANQVGVLKRLFVWEHGDRHGAFVNPEVVETSEEIDTIDEGCLSFPGMFYPTERPLRARMRGVDVHGEPIEQTGEGMMARILLHELDHLNGILFIDHLARHDRKEAMRRIRRGELEHPPVHARAAEL